MNKILVLLFCVCLTSLDLFSQGVEIQITGPKQIRGRRAILLTREKGFASTVHSVKLETDFVELQMASNLVPDLYQLNVSQLRGSLYFFLEQGTKIRLDTIDLARSVVTNSKSNPDWIIFQEHIQMPSDKKVAVFTAGETRARKRNQKDSLAYWQDQKVLENKEFLKQTGAFIFDHPSSYVSLYLLKNNWYAFKNDRLFEKLDASMSKHKSYQLLREKNRDVVKSAADGK